jgi:hypothetical protein
VLTFAYASARRTSRFTAIAGAALALSLMSSANVRPARAEGVWLGSCVGTWHAGNCTMLWAPFRNPYVRQVPQPRNAAERARARAEDERWVDRCRPTIHPDRYGVNRYHYTRPGCEFGVGAF